MKIDKILNKAKSHMRKKQWDQAQMLLKQVLAAFPNNQQAIKNLKEIELQLHDSELTQEQLDRVFDLYSRRQFDQSLNLSNQLMQKHPEIPFFYKISGTCYLELGQCTQAKDCFEKGIKLTPEDGEMHNNLGLAYLEDSQCKSAIRSFKRALRLKSNDAAAYNNLGNAYKVLNQYDLALDYYEKGAKIHPDFAEAHNNIGYVLIQLKREQEAIDSLNKALVLAPDYAMAMNNLGTAYKGLGDSQLAIKHYISAARLEPHDIGFLRNSVQLYVDDGEHDKAVGLLEKSIKDNPKNSEIYNLLGSVFLDSEQLDKALDYLKSAIALNAKSDKAFNGVGRYFYKRDRFNQAVDNFKMALSINAENVKARYNLALSFYRLGWLTDAIKQYQKVLSLEPGFSDAQHNLGLIYFELEQIETAEQHFKRALATHPNHVKANFNLGKLLRLKGQNKIALERFELLLKINPDDETALFQALGLGFDMGQFQYVLAKFQLILDKKLMSFKGNNNGEIEFLALLAKALKWDINSFDAFIGTGQPNQAEGYSLVYQLMRCNFYRFHPFVHKTNECYHETLKALSADSSDEIKNPDLITPNLNPEVPENLVALLHFGRSGTGLLHSLIDNHPEVSTLPSIYFAEYYQDENWQAIIREGWSQIPERFCQLFPLLFNAESAKSVLQGLMAKPNYHLGKQEGMANVGDNKNEVLMVDQDIFCKNLKNLMGNYQTLNPKLFLDLVHLAYEQTLTGTTEGKKLIFYHIHNPSFSTQLNFIRFNPKGRFLMMVREPIQSCESWAKSALNVSISTAHYRIVQMLFDVDQMAFTNLEAVGVRLEDLKQYPKKTIKALSQWLGIKESPTLYEMTAQGKRWWGDPSSTDYNQHENPFDQSSMNRKIGSFFSEQDQFILRTLYYPFRVRFGYCKENLKGFQEDLKTIKPLLEKPFGFEKKIANNREIELSQFLKSGSALFFRSALHDRWQVLGELGGYPNMLKPLKIEGI